MEVMEIDERTIAIVIEATERLQVIQRAWRTRLMLRRFYPDYESLWSFGSVLLNEGGREILEKLWDFQLEEYRQGLRAIYLLAPQHTTDLLENIQFRSACLTLGVIEGPPIRIYDPTGGGVAWRSHLDRLLNGMADPDQEPLYNVNDLWVVVYRVRP